ncbi:MAG TPA: peptide chain release factor N(5)-glutamine methyltransferase [Candidatus Sulfomarinibacteraceae bacterium]|nr:peptide chain release factor N(5)-glutamine methyltransferase [Candidatus Sulfomarinibacteraceae bacterium]
MATVDLLIRDAVDRLRSAGSETPRLDAEVLLASILGVDRTAVVAHPEAPVGEGAAARFGEAVVRREAGEPVAYIRGIKEFLGLAFSVDSRALIPRPETERLVELAEAEVGRRLVGAPRPPGAPPIRVVDVGTGGGAIAVALAVRLRARGMLDHVAITATDASNEAIALARENAVGHAVADQVEFRAADLVPVNERPFDLVLANLPYVRSDALDALPVATSFEPRQALDGGVDGLEVIRRLLGILPDVLAEGGTALLEIGADQEALIGAAVAGMAGRWSCAVERDLAGLPRVARVARPEP